MCPVGKEIVWCIYLLIMTSIFSSDNQWEIFNFKKEMMETLNLSPRLTYRGTRLVKKNSNVGTNLKKKKRRNYSLDFYELKYYKILLFCVK